MPLGKRPHSGRQTAVFTLINRNFSLTAESNGRLAVKRLPSVRLPQLLPQPAFFPAHLFLLYHKRLRLSNKCRHGIFLSFSGFLSPHRAAALSLPPAPQTRLSPAVFGGINLRDGIGGLRHPPRAAISASRPHRQRYSPPAPCPPSLEKGRSWGRHSDSATARTHSPSAPFCRADSAR